MSETPLPPVQSVEPWHAVFACGWKLDIGNDTRDTEEPIAIFRFEEHAATFARSGWPTLAEVRPCTPPQVRCS